VGKVKGVLKLKHKLKTHENATAKGVEVGLIRAGFFLLRESQILVPIDTGALRASGQERAEGSGFDTVVTVSYGTKYAVYVHEDLGAQHAPGKEAKFLQKPLIEKEKQMQRVVRDAVKEHQ